MAHVTLWRFTVLPGRRQAVIDQFEKWEREHKPKATGFESSLIISNNDNPDELMVAVRFQSTENYLANSNRPEQATWFQELRANLAADPVWFNGTVTRELTA